MFSSRAGSCLGLALLLAHVPTPARSAGPQLLITAEDLPRIRHACGVGLPSATPPPGSGRFGARAREFQSLRAHFAHRPDGDPLAGEILAAAFLQLVDPSAASAVAARTFLNHVLATPPPGDAQTLELVLALDWCWEALDPAAREAFILNHRPRLAPLTAGDSPLDSRRFRNRLTGLALTLALDESRDPSPSWGPRRRTLLEAARQYTDTTLPAFLAARGPTPTGPAAAAREELDTALLLELGSRVTRRDLWSAHRATVGRWLEHYIAARIPHPALRHHFLRDDAGQAPLSPTPDFVDLYPLTAHLFAARTGDPCAAALAAELAARVAEPAAAVAGIWQWVPIVWETAEIPPVDPDRWPLARHLGGAVVFRAGRGPETTAVWIEAGQPFLRRRQHYDAGHFLIHRAGHLTVGGGDDIMQEAVPGKAGEQRLGHEKGPFDFEQYYTATIAHNAIVVWDAARAVRWYGALYRPVGGQRCVEGTCTDFATPLETQGRVTGRILAYGQTDAAAYVALDLAPAYEPRTLAAFTREFLFLWGRAVLVIDRLTLPAGRATPTWMVNIPSRPRVDGAELRDAAQIAGTSRAGGIWRYDAVQWLRWTEADGGLWMRTLLPAVRRTTIVGGPARKLLIKSGPHAGRSYVGGDADSFERLILPADRHGNANAWYRLGEPTLLGPEVGRAPHWGRVEVEAAERGTSFLFVTLLVADEAAADTPPDAAVEVGAADVVLNLRAGHDAATVRLPIVGRGGTLTTTPLTTTALLPPRAEPPTTPPPGGVAPPDGAAWPLPTNVEPDPPLPTRSAD